MLSQSVAYGDTDAPQAIPFATAPKVFTRSHSGAKLITGPFKHGEMLCHGDLALVLDQCVNLCLVVKIWSHIV